ncbi:UDP-2,4-diacetamido-2,4,6-trideoxy-beta-L-altropyranose hydrolase [Mucilaginibacter sp. UYCu711]|uniref:UDP-2,4-diacetamido-2,4, 6-trideoxy-beta-L-altropyranose hydrolase n=1 Tax=Mucilaginibacter sp. UYCu711 TaxID=3156339 RepID=UPI003D1C7D7F
MKDKVYIRVDASPKIGLGHLVRCLALADMLKDKFNICFVCLSIPDEVISTFHASFALKVIENESDFFSMISKDDIVVIDAYHFKSDYQLTIKAKARSLVVIDDLHDKEIFADLVINHAPGIKIKDYRYQGYTKFALGPDYALLRPEFLNSALKKRVILKINTVFICFGGSDINNLTYTTLLEVIRYQQFKKIIVVVGSSYLYHTSLASITDFRVHFYNGVSAQRMVEIMHEAELAIVPASGILFECLSAKNIIITGKYIDNQTVFLREFSKFKNVMNCGDFSSSKLKISLDIALKAKYEPNTIVDGKSGKRMLKIFSEL